MIVSMTGFAAATTELPGCSLIVELRSVNHRYLDIQVRLPDELRSLDAAVRELLTAEIKRGKVDCRIALNHALPGATTLAINAERVAQLRAAAAEVLRHAPGSAPLTVVDMWRTSRFPSSTTCPAAAPTAGERLSGEVLRRGGQPSLLGDRCRVRGRAGRAVAAVRTWPFLTR